MIARNKPKRSARGIAVAKAGAGKYYRENAERIKLKSKINRRLKQFGITQDQYVEMWRNQCGRCLICRKHESECKGGELCVDHDHKTGKVRGLLCRKCNVALGALDDSIETLESALEYLKENAFEHFKESLR